MRLLFKFTFFISTLFTIIGCGGAAGSVSGKVSYNGKPVTGGSLTFTPKEAKSAGGVVREDGSYTLEGGAGVGNYKINYSPPVLPIPPGKNGKDPDPGTPAPKTGFEGLLPKIAEVEVKSGKNTIDIELISKK